MHKIVFGVLVFVMLVGIGFWYSGQGSAGEKMATSDEAREMAASFLENYDARTNQAQTAAVAAPVFANSTTTNSNKKIMQATLTTNQGDITIEFSSDAPNTVANFVKLAGDGFYNGTKFHRVIKGFMIQGGDPLTKDDSMMARWGTGGPGYQFADEIHVNNRNDVGTISMANAGPNTNGSQFFINVANNNFLDPKHTVFGKVISGMEVVAKIENTQTGASDRPVQPIVIEGVVLK